MKRFLVALMAASMLTGCYSVTYDLDSLNHAPINGAPKGTFSFEVSQAHYVFALITPSSPELTSRILYEVACAGGRSARKVKVTHQTSVLDTVIGLLTIAIYTPTTIRVEGEVVN